MAPAQGLLAAALAALAALLPGSHMSEDDFPSLKVTGLSIVSNPKGNSSISFEIFDPSPLSNTGTHCSGTWNTKSGYANGQYTLCENTQFEWTFLSFNNTQNFELAASHTFEDDNVGQPPYNYVSTFEKSPINSTNLACLPSYKGTTTCNQAKNADIELDVYALSA